MKFIKTKIKDCVIIEPTPFEDERGSFRRHFCIDEFEQHHLDSKVTQCNISENKKKNTLRGFHYQIPPFEEAKTLTCIKGKLYDIVVDLRPYSPTYLRWEGFELSEQNKRTLHIPKGCAHAFITLKNNTIAHYYVSQKYSNSHERGIRWNDPLFNFKWPHKPLFISEKDSSYPDYKPEK